MSGVARLALSGIMKQFGPVQALRGADFALASGEVHALLGENGAGKSTLMHIAFGMIRPDAGTVRVDGRAVTFRSPRDARAQRIGMVHQHFTSIGALTVEENLALAAGRRESWTAGRLGERLMAGLEPQARVETLPVALRQRLEIVQALATGATILLLDEPSAVLAPSEVEELLGLVRAFVGEGGSAVLITHKLSEVFAAADRVTVLRQGVVTRHGPVALETERSLAEVMIGAGEGGWKSSTGGQAQRETAGLGDANATLLRERREVIALGGVPVYSGEITGIAAVVGNGQRELLRAYIHSPAVAFVPEDRSTEGLIQAFSITENLVLGLPEDRRWAKGFQVNWPAARARAAELMSTFDIRAEGPDAAAATLSGGNQQKVVLARALERRPRVLIAENPTRGLDVRATAEVHARLRAAAAAGVAVVLYSTDLDEVLELSHRVLVVHQRRVQAAPPGADRRQVGEMMLGVR